MAARCLLDPCREDGNVEVQAYEHVYVPHAACDETECVGDARNVRKSLTQSLAVALCPTEKLGHNAAVHSQQAGYPWGKVV